ncbi:hypothetical protein GALMADRAFT_916188 [Galerina marginata CBS 339.88]|uniref:Uncharacterized protein n=1 Tax=Galerina marginata (strain CBS 339.88) TaxID=685588 RepID=A0A067SHT2_GALM3|nr:hypothetical protein GALMADRAFT_916188 [Galerina marginata CBS 339.88]
MPPHLVRVYSVKHQFLHRLCASWTWSRGFLCAHLHASLPPATPGSQVVLVLALALGQVKTKPALCDEHTAPTASLAPRLQAQAQAAVKGPARRPARASSLLPADLLTCSLYPSHKMWPTYLLMSSSVKWSNAWRTLNDS